MANPQKENGHTEIANEIMEALSRVNLSSYEFRVILFVLRKTYGYAKKEDWISLSQFVLSTGIKRPHVCRALRMLTDQRIITKGGTASKPLYRFEKDFDKWVVLPKGARSHGVTKRGNQVVPKGVIQVVPKGAHTKENITKEILQKKMSAQKVLTKEKRKKKEFLENSIEFKLAKHLLFEIRIKNNPAFKTPDLNSWAGEVDKMIRIDGRNIEGIDYLIHWSQQNNFWFKNILSTARLRKQFDTRVAHVKAEQIEITKQASKKQLQSMTF